MTTEAEYQQQIADLKAANAELLEGHGKLSVAYISLRLNRMEDEWNEFRMKVGQLPAKMDKEISELKENLEELRTSIGAVDKALNERITAAGKVVGQLRSSVTDLQKSLDNGS